MPGKTGVPLDVKGCPARIICPIDVVISEATNVILWKLTHKAVSLVRGFDCPRSTESLDIFLNDDAHSLLLGRVLIQVVVKLHLGLGSVPNLLVLDQHPANEKRGVIKTLPNMLMYLSPPVQNETEDFPSTSKSRFT